MGLRKPKPPERNVDLHIYVEPSMLAELSKRAKEADRSLTAEVRRALRAYLEEPA